MRPDLPLLPLPTLWINYNTKTLQWGKNHTGGMVLTDDEGWHRIHSLTTKE